MKSLTKNEAIEMARALVVGKGGVGGENRRWLVTNRVACYGNSDYQTEIHVLEGTPARGYVVVVGYSGGGDVHAYGMYFRQRLGKFRFADENHTVTSGGCLMWTPKTTEVSK